MRHLICGLLIFLVAGCAGRMPGKGGAADRSGRAEPMGVTFLPCPGDLIDRDGRRFPLQALAAVGVQTDFILVGEGHKNECDHGVQARVVEAMALSPRPPAVALEMVAVDRQAVLDDFLAGRVPLSGLAEALDWKDRWGYGFEMYRPVFELALKHKLPLFALNVRPDVIRKVSRDGLESLSPEEAAELPSPVIPQPKEQEQFLLEAMRLHKGREQAGPAEAERFMLVQSIWDTQMAMRSIMARRRFERPVVVLAGMGHVENGWGIASRLRKLDPAASFLLMAPWRGVGNFTPAAADSFFFCPNSYKSKLGMALAETDDGLLVTEVERASRADVAGLRPGDLVLAIQGLPAQSLGTLHDAGAKAYEAKQPLKLTVRRGLSSFTADLGRLGQAQ